MKKIVVIGAGASGIIAALKASENNHVILLERNDKIGKKLALTGNGRCNYWNDSLTKENYHTDSYEVLDNILKEASNTFNMLTKLGIYPKIKNGLYYPASMQATSVCELLLRKLENSDVEIKYNTLVNWITEKDNGFIIKTDNGTIECDKVILAMGAKALSKTGSDGTVFNILNNFNIKINNILPALVPLKVDGDFLKVWNGVRTDVTVSINNTKETGEIQLTDYGISGICVFNISSTISKMIASNEKVEVKINFLPFIEDYNSFIEKRVSLMNNPSLEDLFESILNYKLLYMIFKRADINPKAHYKSLTEREKQTLKELLIAFKVRIIDTLSFDKAQVCTGGVSLTEINNNMELKKIPNLYVIGETLDVDGICGGFNLAFAFITGFIAGRSV